MPWADHIMVCVIPKRKGLPGQSHEQVKELKATSERSMGARVHVSLGEETWEQGVGHWGRVQETSSGCLRTSPRLSSEKKVG